MLKISYCLAILLFNLVFAKNVEVIVQKKQENIEIIFKPEDKANLPIISHFNKGVLAKFSYPVNNISKKLNNLASLSVSADKKNLEIGFVSSYHIVAISSSAFLKKVILQKNLDVEVPVKTDIKAAVKLDIKAAAQAMKEPAKEQKNISQLSDITVENSAKSKDLILNIPFYQGKYAILQRDDILWVIIDNKNYCPKFIFPKNYLNHWQHFSNDSANTFRVNIEGFKAVFSKTDSDLKQLKIYLSKNSNQKEHTRLDLEETDNAYKCAICENFSMHEFFDDINHENIKVVALEKGNFGISKEKPSFYIKFLESLQGLAFIDCCQCMKVGNVDNQLIIEKPASAIGADSILPWYFEGNFLEQKYELSTSIYTAESKKAKLACIIKLAKLYFSQGFYPEALSVLQQLQSFGEEYFAKDMKLKFFESVLFYLSGDKQKAIKLLDDLIGFYGKKNMPVEIALWYCWAQEEYKQIKDLFLINLPKFLKDYNQEVFWSIATDLLGYYLNDSDITSAKNLVTKLPNEPREDLFYLRQKYLCYKADLMIALGKSNAAEKTLKNLLEDEKSHCFLLPNFLYNKALYYSGKLNAEEVARNLENCRLLNKEDADESALLDFLANLYATQGDYVKELRILKYKKANLANYSNANFYQNIHDTYHKLFIEQDFINKSNAFDAVATFIEFQDLLPLGEDADKLVFAIINKLVNLDLLQHSIDLLEHQINYRLSQDNPNVAYTNYLALLHLLNKAPEKAICVLEASDKNTFSLDEYNKRVKIRAKALIDLKKYDQALECLKADFSEEGLIFKAEIFFQSQNWQEYINLVSPYVISKLQNEDKISQKLVPDVLKLGMSFLLLEDNPSFSNLLSMVQKKDYVLVQEMGSLDVSKPSMFYAMLEKYATSNNIEGLVEQYLSPLSILK